MSKESFRATPEREWQWQLRRVKDNGAYSNFLYLKLRLIAS
jgi:hypothetical protein